MASLLGVPQTGVGITNGTEPLPKLCKEQNYSDNRMCGLLISDGTSIRLQFRKQGINTYEELGTVPSGKVQPVPAGEGLYEHGLLLSLSPLSDKGGEFVLSQSPMLPGNRHGSRRDISLKRRIRFTTE